VTRQQIVVVIVVAALLLILAALAIHEAWTTRGQEDDPEWKDDYTGWGG